MNNPVGMQQSNISRLIIHGDVMAHQMKTSCNKIAKIKYCTPLEIFDVDVGIGRRKDVAE